MNRSDRPHLIVAARSHPGMQRHNNEDRYAVRSYKLGKSGLPVVAAVVSDGIGGHQAGEVAAQITVETVLKQLKRFAGGDPAALITDAVLEANRAVSDAASSSADQSGMGATLALVMVVGSQLYTATVGDSRIYLLRDKRLRQISIDHTWVQEAIEYEIISPEEARDHPQAHVLRRHIGGDQPPDPDFRMFLEDGESEPRALANQGVGLQAGDQVLLCSDGLTDMVEDQEIHNALNTRPPELAVEALIELALQRGGLDNITVVVLGMPESVEGYMARPPSSRLQRLLPAVLMLILFSIIGMGLVWWLGLWPW
ncbi:MAG: protein phosphatase 2C domain-containing protein [Anaerolineales bacterium]